MVRGATVRVRPQATFLTQIGRSPVVRRAATPGVYALDFEAVPRLRQRLRQLESELTALTGGAADTTEEVARTRALRTKMTAAVRAIESQLEEALRSLAIKGADENGASSASA
jgi:uncharacterized protein YigA (DUF484 family)